MGEVSARVDAVPADAPSGAGVAPRWRILMVDDCADDAELARLALVEAGIDADCRCVEGELALVQALASFAPQLVLSDRSLPGFSGQRALQLVRELAPLARFVFVSGTPEDPEAMRLAVPAADAWLCKDDLAPLPALVRRLLAGQAGGDGP